MIKRPVGIVISREEGMLHLGQLYELSPREDHPDTVLSLGKQVFDDLNRAFPGKYYWELVEGDFVVGLKKQ